MVKRWSWRSSHGCQMRAPVVTSNLLYVAAWGLCSLFWVDLWFSQFLMVSSLMRWGSVPWPFSRVILMRSVSWKYEPLLPSG
jgi:hypothetical protein